MAVIEAGETRFRGGIPERFVAALSVHVVEGGWAVRLKVRPGTGLALRHLAEEWELLQFRAEAMGSTQGPQDDRSGLITLLQYATLEDLPRR